MFRLTLLTVLLGFALGMAPLPPLPEEEPPGSDCCGPMGDLLVDHLKDLTLDALDDVWDSIPPAGGEIQVLPFSAVAGGQGAATGVFGCAARAPIDAESVRIVKCESGPDFANTVVAPGSMAATVGVHTETTNTSMIRSVCYEVNVRYIDGRTPQTVNGCSQAMVLVW